MSLTRLEAAAAEADEFLSGLITPPSDEAPITGTVPAEDAPTPQDQAAPGTDIEPQKAESDQTKAQLDDENNPTWKAKYLTLQGMFNRMNQEVKELKEAVKQAPATIVQEQPKDPPVSPELFQRLSDDLGPEMAGIVKNLIEGQAVTEEKIQQHLQPYEERIKKMEQSQAQTAGEQFFNAITVGCPDWKQINGWAAENIPQHPAFTTFIEQTIPGTDYTYDDLIQHYQQTGNARKIVEIFNLFKASQQSSAPVAAAASPSPKAPSVSNYIDPSKTGKGASPPDSAKPKTYSQAEVNRFYDSVVKGTFRGTLEEKTMLDAEYNQAIIEGRVT